MNISQRKKIVALGSIHSLKNEKKNAQKVSIHMTSEQVDHPKYLQCIAIYIEYTLLFFVSLNQTCIHCTMNGVYIVHHCFYGKYLKVYGSVFCFVVKSKCLINWEIAVRKMSLLNNNVCFCYANFVSLLLNSPMM